jgi:GNAT superfamily N-acetyltransferase
MLKFPMGPDAMHRLPRHPDWKYEMVRGEAWLSHRARPLSFLRSTSVAVEAAKHSDTQIRMIDPRGDRAQMIDLITTVWAQEDPYRSLEDPNTLLRAEIERSLNTPSLGVVVADAQTIYAAALVPCASANAPTLTWLTVRREARDQGLATSLLRVIVETLLTRGVQQLASGASAANVPSLRWHLSRGFQLAPDPLRDALRLNRPPSSLEQTG